MKFLSILWDSSETIAQKAQNYNARHWYKSCRFVPMFFYLILNILGALITTELGISSAVFVGLVFFVGLVVFPFMFFAAKGYRWMILGSIILICWDRASNFQDIRNMGMSFLVAHLFIWFLFVRYLVRAFRIENYRQKNGLAERKSYGKDILIFLGVVVLLFIAFLASGFVAYKRESLDPENTKKVHAMMTIYMNTNAVKEYCQKQGVDLISYPAEFSEKFAPQISALNQIMAQDPKKKEMLEKRMKSYNFEQIIEDERKYIIMMRVARENTNQNQPQSFEWNDSYNQIITPQNYCKMIDASFPERYNSGYFASFEELVNEMQKK